MPNKYEDSEAYLRSLFARRRSRKALTVYVQQRHVSRSGMLRVLRLYVIRDNELLDITHHVNEVLRWGFDRNRWGVKVSGCGMDMHFHTVYCLSVSLFGHDNRGGYRLKHTSI